MTPDLNDQASLQRGMQLYTNYCMGCHSLEHQRFARAAEDFGMPQDLVEENLIFSSDLAYNDQMHIAMNRDDAANWFGAAAPDLTLQTRVRSADWIYSYLLTFYRDPSRPNGVNNEVFDMVAMPNVLEPLQGVQEKVCAETDRPGEGAELDPLTGKYQSCDVLQVTRPGSMEPDEFEEAVYDLTNFLAYVGEPSKLQAQVLGRRCCSSSSSSACSPTCSNASTGAIFTDRGSVVRSRGRMAVRPYAPCVLSSAGCNAHARRCVCVLSSRFELMRGLFHGCSGQAVVDDLLFWKR
jgi:ubiquinol-cytochrome c reductase cytochrome c1 subunit